MKTLVLCVDRDNDLGVKTGIRGPLVGRDDVLAAAMKLGLADPEDSDVNSLLTAISTYDELIRSGQGAEVAAITGDIRVGPISDSILTQQFDDVLDEVRPDRAYLVSDGAEDESIFPMIASRLRVDHVRRVFVRQNPGVESTWYLVARAWKDPKIRRKIVVPLGLSLILFSLFSLTFDLRAATVALGLLWGLYIILSAFTIRIRDVMGKPRELYERVRSAPERGSIAFYFWVIAIVPILVGILFGYQEAAAETGGPVAPVLDFIAGALPWFIFGFLAIEAGRYVETYLRKGRVPRQVLFVAGSFVALGLVILALVKVVSIVFGIESTGAVPFVASLIGLAALLLVLGTLIARPRDREAPTDSWRH